MHTDKQCLYRAEDWWTYELCFGKGVRQYHQEAPVRGAVGIEPNVADGQLVQISLGAFNIELTDLNKIQVRQSTNCMFHCEFHADQAISRLIRSDRVDHVILWNGNTKIEELGASTAHAFAWP